MKLRGTVFSGALRGAPLIEKYYARLIGVVGFRPFFGTLNVKLDRNFDLASYATKRLDHITRGGALTIEAQLVPVVVRKCSKNYAVMQAHDREGQILDRLRKLRKDAKEDFEIETGEVFEGHECWAMQFIGEFVDQSVVELIAKDQLRAALNLTDGDLVEIIIKDDSYGKHTKNKI